MAKRKFKRSKPPVGFVLYSDEEITALVCVACHDPLVDSSDVPIYEPGVIKCLRCGEVAE